MSSKFIRATFVRKTVKRIRLQLIVLYSRSIVMTNRVFFFVFFYRRVLTSVRKIARNLLRRKLRGPAGDRQQKCVRRKAADFAEDVERHVQREGIEVRW